MTNYAVSLQDDNQALNEVVVVGYGVQKKVNLTGSVSSVKGDALEMRPVTDASQSLQGLVPGLMVSNGSSGRPGATAALSLRGQGNLSGTGHPYVLVDGIEMSLADVNPNDIESISVLKMHPLVLSMVHVLPTVLSWLRPSEERKARCT